MLKRIRKNLNKKGFTLVELIVVIAVLGILATVAVPRLGGITDDAKSKADEANKKILQNAAEMHYAEHGDYPDSASDFEAYVPDLPTQNDGTSFYYDSSEHEVVTSSAENTFEIKESEE